MQRVVIAVETVQQSRLGVSLVFQCGIWRLPFGRREVLRRRPLGSAPVALSNEESRADNTSVDLASLGINEVNLRLNDGTRTALVIDTEDLGARFEAAAFGRRGKGLVEFDLALSVNDTAGVEVGDAGDLDGFLVGIKVDYFLGVLLEG